MNKPLLNTTKIYIYTDLLLSLSRAVGSACLSSFKSFFMKIFFPINLIEICSAAWAKKVLPLLLVCLSVFIQAQNIFTSRIGGQMDINDNVVNIEELRKHPDFGKIQLKDSTGKVTPFIELVDRRDEYSTVFAIPGTQQFSKRASDFPLHYKDKNGLWRNIETVLEKSATQPYVYEISKQTFPITYHSKTGETGFTVDKAGNIIGLSKNIQHYQIDKQNKILKKEQKQVSASGKVAGQSATISNYFPNIDYKHEFEEYGVKSSFVIMDKSVIHPSSEYVVFTEELTLPKGWNIKHDAEGGIALKMYDESGKAKATMMAPFYYDAFRVNSKEDKAAHQMYGSYNLKEKDGKYTVEILVPTNWLLQPERVFPVVIDPLVVTDDYSILGVSSTGWCGYNYTIGFGGQVNITNTRAYWTIVAWNGAWMCEQVTQLNSVGGQMGPYTGSYGCAEGTQVYDVWTGIGNGTTDSRTYTHWAYNTWQNYGCATNIQYINRRYFEVYFDVIRCYWFGDSGFYFDLNSPAPCDGSWRTLNVGSGTYTHHQLHAGSNYTVETCGSSFDTDLTIYEAPFWTHQGKFATNNCGDDGSITFTASYSDWHLFVVNRSSCQGHDFSGTSAILRIRENVNAGTLTTAGTNQTTICVNGTANFNISGSIGISRTWIGAVASVGSTSLLAGWNECSDCYDGQTSFSRQFNTPGTYLVRTHARGAGSGCWNWSSYSDVWVTVSPRPEDGNISVSSATLCAGQTVTVNPSGGVGTPHYWVSNDGGNTWLLSAQPPNNGNSFNYTASTPGTYLFHARWNTACGWCWDAGNNGCPTWPSATATVNQPLMSSSISLNTTTICQGQSITATRNGSIGTGQDRWWMSRDGVQWAEFSDGYVGQSSWTRQLNTPGTYQIYHHPWDNACGWSGWTLGRFSATITVTATPSAGTLSGNQNICVNGTTTFSSTVSGGSWSTSNGAIATVNASTGVVTGITNGTATITYTVTGTGGCSNATATRTVTVNSTTNNPGAISLSASTVCAGTSVNINNVTAATTGSPASAGPNYYYYWNDGSGWRMFNGPTSSLSVTLPAQVTNTPGTYTIARNSEFGCAGQVSAPFLTLTVSGNPVLTATPTAGCGTSSVSLSLTASGCSPTLNTGHYDMFPNAGAFNSSLYTRSGPGVGQVDVWGQPQFYGDNTWGNAFYTNGTVARVAGRVFQGRWYNTGSYSMVGWKNGTANTYTDLVHAFYPYNSGGLEIYEDGNWRGDFTSQASGIIGLNKWIEFKIVLKATGAEYYLRNYNAGENWRHIYSSNHSSATNLRAAVANYSSCCWFYTDDWFVGGLAQYPATTGLYAGTYNYGAQDQHGNIATTSVNVVVNRPSVALSTTVSPAGVCSGGNSTIAVNTASATGGLLNYSTWTVGTGSATGFDQNGSTSENTRINGTGPWGNSTVVWETKPLGNNDADGGWNSTQFPVDPTKLYRYSVWVRRPSGTSSGNFYMGVYGFNSGNSNIGTENLSDGATNTNPYWDCPGIGALPQNEWVLVVGHVYPQGTTFTGKHPNTGRWNLAGVNIAATACNIGSGDVRWKTGTVSALHRTYHYYSTSTDASLQFLYPRVDVVDGSEPSLQDLINGFDVNGGLGTGATWQWYAGSCGGSLVGTGTSVSVAPTSTTDYFVSGVGTCNTSPCKNATVTINQLPSTPTITAGGPTTFCSGSSVQLTASSSLAGNALSFNGTAGVNLGNPPKLRIAGNMTIEMWLYPTDFSARRNPYNKAYAGEGTITQEPNGTLNFYQGSLGADGGTGACTAGNYEGFGSGTALTLNQWNHIALVRDMAAGQLRWYINGNLTNTLTFCQTPVAGNSPVIIGAGYTNPYVGQIDEVRIWNVARTAAEVQNNRFTTVAPGSAGLAGYYRFDEPSGTSVFDASGSSVTGTLGASPVRVISTAPLTPAYTWSPATGLNTTTGAVVTASPTSTQTYIVAAASPHGCGNSTTTQTVTVSTPPVAGTLSGTQDICVGGSTTFSSTVTGGSWSSGNTAVATINSSIGAISGLAAGTATMTYTVMGTGGCANATATRVVTVNSNNQSSSTWTGDAADTDWFNPANWSHCTPGTNTVVVIPENRQYYPVINTGSNFDSGTPTGIAKAKKVNLETTTNNGVLKPTLNIGNGAELRVND